MKSDLPGYSIFMMYLYYPFYIGSAIVDKKFIPITGGGAITITGPCFQSLIRKVICNFEHTKTTGAIIGSNTALCPLPLFTRLGQHRLWLSEDNGHSFNFHTIINIGKILNINIGRLCNYLSFSYMLITVILSSQMSQCSKNSIQICDWICQKGSCTHTNSSLTFHCHSIDTTMD